MSPFRKLIKDYFLVCESYYAAIKTEPPSRIEALDMGRRGLHNEGSQILQQRLDGKIGVDFDTARRLFTLILRAALEGVTRWTRRRPAKSRPTRCRNCPVPCCSRAT